MYIWICTLFGKLMTFLCHSPFPSLYLSFREPSRPTSLLPADWSSALALGREDEPLPPGLETLPLRLMQQDCTALKTLLLRLRRTLQEVGLAHANTSIRILLNLRTFWLTSFLYAHVIIENHRNRSVGAWKWLIQGCKKIDKNRVWYPYWL